MNHLACILYRRYLFAASLAHVLGEPGDGYARGMAWAFRAAAVDAAEEARYGALRRP